MLTGTAYFESKLSAIMNYNEYGYDDVRQAVERKLSEGEIHIGQPDLKPGEKLNMHYHDCEEMQYVIDGYGILRDSENKEYQLRPSTTFYCHTGPKGAHEIKNTGNVPFVCLYIYHSPGGKRVSLTRLAD